MLAFSILPRRYFGAGADYQPLTISLQLSPLNHRSQILNRLPPYPIPTIVPSDSKSICEPEGFLPKPGMSITLPAMGTIYPAPA